MGGGKHTSKIEPSRECAPTTWHRTFEEGVVPSPAGASRLRSRCGHVLLLDLHNGGKSGNTTLG